MNVRKPLRLGCSTVSQVATGLVVLLAGCGGGSGGSTGTLQDSGPHKTFLRAEASDVNGDALQYQWRVTSGSITNANSQETIWTMPDGPGLHFAYVVVSDGKGGYAEQQYAVSTDALATTVPPRQELTYTPRAVADFSGTSLRLRFQSPNTTEFAALAGGTSAVRRVYLPDMVVQLVNSGTGETVFNGLTDLGGEVDLPKLRADSTYQIRCATSDSSALANCGSLSQLSRAQSITVTPPLGVGRNLRLYGHVAMADGAVCGVQNDFFKLQAAATVRLLQADGSPLTAAIRVNRYGDYAIDAAVPVKASLQLDVRCEGVQQTLPVPASPDPAGYNSSRAVELSHVLANTRPRIVKVVANGANGNVRGLLVEPEVGVLSNGLPGANQFLTYKGKDTPLSACMYYRALGAVKDCDAQGRMIEPISFDDWKRKTKMAPHTAGNTEVSADYINKMDLNLVRRMVATQSAPDNIAFYVCNSPGPEGKSQLEIDQVLDTAFGGGKQVACVAMESSPSPGVNGGRPFTKFLTFGPDGALLPSINLDTRGEKYLPGACVACHGGTVYNGRFPEKGDPSAFLGSGFLPFDTANYLFSSKSAYAEPAQGASLHALNRLAVATEPAADTPMSRLVQGWYANSADTLDKSYVPKVWRDEDAINPGAARFYREVVGSSCRTCHVSLGANFDWDTTLLTPSRASAHVCGGTADLAINASMPNALISTDRVAERVQADPALAALMTKYLGCSTPLPDPVYSRR